MLRSLTPRRRLATAAWLVAVTSIAWLDPHQAVRDANRLYAEGKYEDAAAAYNAALVDKPDSADLHFNLGDATYKQGQYEDAVSSFQKVETAGDPQRAGRVAYNVGNASYRQGQAVEQTEPQKALTLYAEALASYRRALGLAPDDEDSKFNHELVTKRIEDLEKKLEEQEKEQEQNQDQKQDQQQPQDDQQKDQAEDKQPQDEQPPQDQQQEDQDQKQAGEPHEGGDQKDQPPQDEKQPSEPSEDERQNAQQPGENPPPEAVAGEHKDGELSKGEAAAILDSQRSEEVSPEDIIKKLQGARVAEPAQDW